ncbi:DNA transformation protein [Bradyrhizobium sp. USDA 4369]
MDREFLIELFAGFGPVTIRRMFSGFGISADGINFALALRSGLYLRADEASFAKFEAAGSQPFSYETRARTMTVRSYWQVPAHLFDDADEFTLWAREAFVAAQTAALSKRSKTRAASPMMRDKAAAAAPARRANAKTPATNSKPATAPKTAKKTAKKVEPPASERARKTARRPKASSTRR